MKKSIKSLILDMDGVIWRNKVPIGNLQLTFQEIANAGLKFAFATNNSTKTIRNYQGILSGFGIPVFEEQIFTSASVTGRFLKSALPQGSELFVIGMSGLKETLISEGFRIGDENPSAVVVGLDENFTYDDLKTAVRLILDGRHFYGTNPDVALPTPDGLNPGAGSILAAIQAASGISPFIIGKPKPIIFQEALKYLHTSPEETLVIGDRLSTDIAGGMAAGCQTGLVLSGVTTRAEAERWQTPIDFIADNLFNLLEVINV